MAPVKLVLGKTNVRTSGYPSEAGFVRQVNAGMQEITKNLLYCLDQFEGATPEIMYDALKPTFDKTQVRVPYKSGELKASGYLEIVGWRGTPQVQMGYAKGGHPDYAAYVHEMVEIPHTAPTSAKFVEAPVNEDIGNIIDRLADGYRRFMGV